MVRVSDRDSADKEIRMESYKVFSYPSRKEELTEERKLIRKWENKQQKGGNKSKHVNNNIKQNGLSMPIKRHKLWDWTQETQSCAHEKRNV